MEHAKFKPRKPRPMKYLSTPMHISREMAEEVKAVAKAVGTSKQEVIRQMIRHCLDEMGGD